MPSIHPSKLTPPNGLCPRQVVTESPEACVLTEMLCRLVTDKLAEFSYNAALAGERDESEEREGKGGVHVVHGFCLFRSVPARV